MSETEGFVDVKDNRAREAARELVVVAGVRLENWAQVVDYAKYMSSAGYAVAKPLRGNLGACMRIIEQATRWGFNHWDLACHCYVVNDVLAFDSQTVHAIIEKFAPIKERLRGKFEGEIEKGTRTCTVIGHFKGELTPVEYTSPKLADITPKNSPLWKSDPDQQLWYFATRRWARRYCPDVLLGAYALDEMQDAEPQHVGFENAKDVTPAPKLTERLGGEEVVTETLADIEARLSEAAAT